MYNDMYNNFDNEEIEYYYPFTFDGQNRSYLIKKDNPDFIICGNVDNIIQLTIDVEVEATLNIEIKNFRFDIAYSLEDIEYQNPINLELKKDTLKDGLYLLEVSSNGINSVNNIILRKVVLVNSTTHH